MTDDSSHSNCTDRRTFLRATGVALTGATVTAGAASARGPPESDAHVAKADFSNGISTDRIEEVRRTARAEYNARGGDFDVTPAVSNPDPEDGTIVSYSYKIDANGVPRQYTGVAGDAKSAAKLHGKAARRATAFDRTSTATADGVATQSASWNDVLHDEADFCSDPYGCVTNNLDLKQLDGDGDSAQDAYAVKHFFVMEPGTQKYDSGWVNDVGEPKHDWSQNDMGNADLDEYDPLGTHDGSQSIKVSVGTSGASLGWSYTQPAVTTIDESSPSGNYATWNEEFNTDAARRNTNGMKPGSSCWIDQEATGSGQYDLMDLVSKGTFYDGGWSSDTYYLKHTFHLKVNY
ncbi:hypothetical protein [Halorussus aquaticus]|uniref:Tat (Twin-arginine translocation) pathway signal sequence n=1 Tax=Halorussus aquaticus TaxID=2953748 RepID=A0ABD5Q0D4_9EURY|nr:hypothetical protein [Halorussus aquaticus]